MAKVKFVCQQCGYESLKWLGRCPDCSSWNSFIEEIVTKSTPSISATVVSSQPVKLSEIDITQTPRLATGIAEFDRTLGGGVVESSLILIGGEPGIGKSTLLLQVASRLSQLYGSCLYISGEESIQQIKLRADRLTIDSSQLYILSETNIEFIITHLQNLKPQFAFLDSIQTTYNPQLPSLPGSVNQIRDCTLQLLNFIKSQPMALFLAGHVTKEGAIAGPKVLEHIVDTVLYFEGERRYAHRILRATKNRFGSTNELGVFEMSEQGLIPVENPSEVFLGEAHPSSSGIAITAIIEGTRPMLVELQALTTNACYGTPRRQTSGLDYNRACLILAVLEKRLGLTLSNQDVFLNVAGGIRITEPGADLGMALAVVSNLKDVAMNQQTVVFGEVGLGGEIRAVSQAEARLKEAARIGFKRCVLPKASIKTIKTTPNIELVGAENLREAIEQTIK